MFRKLKIMILAFHITLMYAESIILTLINYKFLHVKVTYE